MKKLAIGCGVVLLLLCVVVAGVSYYVYRQASATFAQLRELSQVPQIESTVKNRASFSPPTSEELTAGQVERLVRVQAQVRQRLGQRFSELETKYKSFMDKKEPTVLDVPALLAAYRDVASAWMEAKRSQADALNSVDMSLEEYRWIRNQAYRALGMPYLDFDVAKIMDGIRNNSTTIEPGKILGSIGPAGPESNRKLVEQFKKQLEENLPLASFGL
jgi:hypothetical protein